MSFRWMLPCEWLSSWKLLTSQVMSQCEYVGRLRSKCTKPCRMLPGQEQDSHAACLKYMWAVGHKAYSASPLIFGLPAFRSPACFDHKKQPGRPSQTLHPQHVLLMTLACICLALVQQLSNPTCHVWLQYLHWLKLEPLLQQRPHPVWRFGFAWCCKCRLLTMRGIISFMGCRCVNHLGRDCSRSSCQVRKQSPWYL